MALLVKTLRGLAIASVKTADGLAIASVKTVNGLDNTAAAGWTGNLVSTDFEGTGIPAGWSINTGTPNWDNVSNPQAGAQDLMLNASVTTDVQCSFAAQTEIWIKFRFRRSGAVTSGIKILYVSTAGAQYYSVGLSSSGQLQLNQTTTLMATSVDAMATATSYFIWVHAKKGTGANAAFDVEFATTDVRVGSGNKRVALTTGTHTQDFTIANPYHVNTESSSWQYDNFNVGNTTYP